jgi:pimeloyl-ACP methyl ester carboxylesterase
METAAAWAALADAGAQGPCDLIGHSAGGTLALDFALRHPEFVRSLTLIEPGPTWVLRRAGAMTADVERFLARRLAAYRGPINEASYAKFLQDTLPGTANIAASPHWPLLFAYRENIRFRAAFHEHTDDLACVSSARFPVLLIRGAQSDEFYHATIDVLARTFPNARVVEMPGGHAPHAGEATETFVRLFRSFARQCASRRMSIAMSPPPRPRTPRTASASRAPVPEIARRKKTIR